MVERRVFTIFLASPDDLQKERLVVEEAVDSVNKHLARYLDLVLEIRKWEDTLPGAGRPQALINEDAAGYDLFLGLLWKKWGTPTGEYSSGFEEEFELAKSRRATGSSVDVWIFLKDIQDTSDPGPQMQAALAFRSNVAEQVLYKTFGDENALRITLRECLDELVARRFLPVAQGPTQTLPAATSSDVPQPLEGTPAPGTAIIPTLSSALADPTADPTELDAVRLFLFAAARLYKTFLPGQVLGGHENHFLFLRRTDFELSNPERLLILTTLIEDTQDTKVGWWWLRDVVKNPEPILWHLAYQGGASGIRTQSFKYLGELDTIALATNAIDLLGDPGPLVQRGALHVLARHGSVDSLDGIEPLLTSENVMVRSAALDAYAAVLSRTDRSRLGKWLAGLPADATGFLGASISSLVSNLSAADIEPLLSHKDDHVRLAALDKFANTLPPERLNELRSDSARAVSLAAVRELLTRGVPIAPRDLDVGTSEGTGVTDTTRLWDLYHSYEEEARARPLLVSAMKLMPRDEIDGLIDWGKADETAAIAYQALAELDGPAGHTRVREDIRNGFDGLRARFMKQLSSLKAEATQLLDGRNPPARLTLQIDELAESFERLSRLLTSRFVLAGVSALVAEPNSDDLEIVRDLADNYSQMNRSALLPMLLDLLDRLGDASDVPRVIRFLDETSGSVRLKAASIALRLAANSIDLAKALLGRVDTDVKRQVLKTLRTSGRRLSDSEIESLLGDSTEGVRVSAVAYMAEGLSAEDLEAVLATYLARPTYYYNVVAWLDRLLYSPGPLRKVFVRRLRAEADKDLA